MATLKQYKGPQYDSSCLTDAWIRTEQFKLSFPQQSRQMELDRQLEEIENMIAEKELEIADFYRRTKQKKAAIYYWTYITENRPDTPAAVRAQEALQIYNTTGD